MRPHSSPLLIHLAIPLAASIYAKIAPVATKGSLSAVI